MIKTVHLDKVGLEMFLGKTEAKIMMTLWEGHTGTLTEVHNALIRSGEKLAYPTTSTILNRLVKKGLVHKTREPHPIYTPVVTEDQFLKKTFARLDRVLADNYNMRVR